MMKTMEKLMDKLSAYDKNQMKDQMNLKLEILILGGNKGVLFLKSCQGGKETQMNNK